MSTISFEIDGGTSVDAVIGVDDVHFDRGGAAGDVIAVDLRAAPTAPADGVGPFTPPTFDLIRADGTIAHLTVTRSQLRPGDMTLTRGNQVYGHVISSERAEGSETPFTNSGRFYLAAGSASDLSGDTDPSAPGFQGTLRVNYQWGTQSGSQDLIVTAGHTTRGDSIITAPNSVLDAMRLQQRLNYLGFPDRTGKPLAVDGIVGTKTASALQLFKAAINVDGVSDPRTENADVDAETLNWLNSTHAPRWVKFEPPPNHPLTDPFGTSWTIDTIQAVRAALPSVRVLAISPSAWLPDDSQESIPGSHRAGMGVDLLISTQTAQLVAAMKAFFQNTAGSTVKRFYVNDRRQPSTSTTTSSTPQRRSTAPATLLTSRSAC